MLGRYMGSLDIKSVIGTASDAQETLVEIMPTIEMIAEDYVKVRPGVDFMSKYWYTVFIAIAFSTAIGAGVGSWFVLKRLEKKR